MAAGKKHAVCAPRRHRAVESGSEAVRTAAKRESDYLTLFAFPRKLEQVPSRKGFRPDGTVAVFIRQRIWPELHAKCLREVIGCRQSIQPDIRALAQ